MKAEGFYWRFLRFKMFEILSPASSRTLPCIFNLRAEITPIAILHDNAQVVLPWGKERVFVADNIGVVQPPQEIHLCRQVCS